MRILVVEDEKDIADLVEYHLKQANFPVEVVTEGSSVLERAKKKSPSLIILDLMLPGMDGLEVCRRIRARGHALILMLTAMRSEVDRVIGLEMGADDYITKPFDEERLLHTIKRAMEHHALIQKNRALEKKIREKEGVYQK